MFGMTSRTTATRVLSRNLSGKASAKPVAIVTGAARGLGRAISLRLARDGYDIALNDLPSSLKGLEEVKKTINEYGRGSIICTGDVSVEKDVKALVQNTAEGLGGLDVMVANAGICVTKPFVETTTAEWDKIHAVNLRGPFLSYKYAAMQMIKQGRGGRIIGACSIAGKQGWGNLVAYSSTKFGVRGLTQGVAQELGKHGINVNAYAPGPTRTDLLAEIGTRMGNKDELYEKWRAETALGLSPTPEDIASLVSFLASPSSKMMTGQTVNMDCGRVFD